MRFVIQRVTSARVDIDGETVGSIGKGYMVLIGVGKDDTEETADKYLSKMLKLRIFEDENGNTNAGAPEMAEKLYDYIVSEAKKTVPVVETGRFGADMQVSLVNDGPFTIILEDL